MAEAADNRTRILEQALALFVAHGYDAVGVQTICEAASVTKPTLYHYFGNKRGLLDAIRETWYTPFTRTLGDAAHFNGDLAYTLQQVVQTYFSFARRHPAAYRLLLASWFVAPQNDVYAMSADVHAQQQRVLEDVFVIAARGHGNMRERHRIYAATLIGTINTYVVLWLNGEGDLDDRAARAAVQQFTYGIYS